MNRKKRKGSLNSIRKEIQWTHLGLIIIITILLGIGGTYINVKDNDISFDQNLQDTAELLTQIYGFAKNMNEDERISYFDSLWNGLVNIDVISIVGKDKKRIYHTNHELIGTTYYGTIPDFKNHSNYIYTENDTGPSGPQRRTYAALFDEDGNYEGFILTVMLKTSIKTSALKTIYWFITVTLISILIEVIISETISKRIKQKLLGYEPDTFSSMFMIRENILESIYDGIVAVDSKSEIQFANKAGCKMLNLESGNEKMDFINQKVFADKYLSSVLESGEGVTGIREIMESGTELVMDCMPIREKDEIKGAVAILHDRTEYKKLMEELSGTKYLIDSMRANNHDFTNKLHVILGLIQIGEYDKAVSYIENISIIQRETLSKVMNSIDHPSFAALIIGKIARASECNVKFVLEEGSYFSSSHVDVPGEALVTISGNLIDNALDSMNLRNVNDMEQKELVFGVFTKPGSLIISVEDNGTGMDSDVSKRVFEKGFSTKGNGRGVGLYHTKQLVESLGGKIYFESKPGLGTTFVVRF